MRKMLLAAAAVACASPASAAVVYSNNFDAENGGNTALNYNGFNGLTVTDGTVDLVKSGDFGITCAGGAGSCVDLDGSTGNSGLTSSASYSFTAGDEVALSYLFSGNQRGGAADSFTAYLNIAASTSVSSWGYRSSFYGNVTFGPANTTGFTLSVSSIGSADPFRDLEFFFVASEAGAVSFQFQDGGNDNVGVILDDVSLSIAAVPEPSVWAMMILGFGAVGAAIRRRKATATTAFA